DSVTRLRHQWQFTCYDALNRPDSTGLITDPLHYNNLGYHQNLAAGSTIYPDLASYTAELLTQIFYDNYAGISAASGLPVIMANINSGNFFTTYNAAPVYAVSPTAYLFAHGLK